MLVEFVLSYAKCDFGDAVEKLLGEDWQSCQERFAQTDERCTGYSNCLPCQRIANQKCKLFLMQSFCTLKSNRQGVLQEQ